MEKEKDLNHHQEETDNLQKSVEPDSDYMKAHDLCVTCHGAKHDGACKKD